jgi:hypothetical protein
MLMAMHSEENQEATIQAHRFRGKCLLNGLYVCKGNILLRHPNLKIFLVKLTHAKK